MKKILLLYVIFVGILFVNKEIIPTYRDFNTCTDTFHASTSTATVTSDMANKADKVCPQAQSELQSLKSCINIVRDQRTFSDFIFYITTKRNEVEDLFSRHNFICDSYRINLVD